MNLLNVKYKAMAEMARSFFESSINPKFITNIHHLEQYLWHVEERREIPDPGRNSYLNEEFWTNIRRVKDEGLLYMARMTTGQWYTVFLENNITL